MSDTLWYENAIIYELHVRAFFDGNAGGIGDFRGLIEKLDYLADVLPYFGDGREGAD
jgi:maltose alpha-D-glucosyltransferase / alpha-amylase